MSVNILLQAFLYSFGRTLRHFHHIGGHLFISSSVEKHSGSNSRARQLNLIICQIGRRLLLQAADSTLRVGPVTEIKEGTFLLKFENEFVFSYDSLVVVSQDLVPKPSASPATPFC